MMTATDAIGLGVFVGFGSLIGAAVEIYRELKRGNETLKQIAILLTDKPIAQLSEQNRGILG